MSTLTTPNTFSHVASGSSLKHRAMTTGSDDLKERARRLAAREVDFIPNDQFSSDNAEEAIGGVADLLSDSRARDARAPRDLPSHLARMCEIKLLTAEQEIRLFRRMNYLKFKAQKLIAEIDVEQPRARQLDAVESCLAEAQSIRDRVVTSNMRLVISVVKKLVSPQLSFDDLLSDGTFSLIQAAEKFDYDRGFRFSTYAYRAIARNAYRKISDAKKESARYSAVSEEDFIEANGEAGGSSVGDEACDRLRKVLIQLVGRLDRREQFIIRCRYALGAHRKARTFQSMADKLGLSKERVRQLERRAVAKLQSFAAELNVDDLLGAALVQ